jgi:hypothetical protein
MVQIPGTYCIVNWETYKPRICLEDSLLWLMFKCWKDTQGHCSGSTSASTLPAPPPHHGARRAPWAILSWMDARLSLLTLLLLVAGERGSPACFPLCLSEHAAWLLPPHILFCHSISSPLAGPSTQHSPCSLLGSAWYRSLPDVNNLVSSTHSKNKMELENWCVLGLFCVQLG